MTRDTRFYCIQYTEKYNYTVSSNDLLFAFLLALQTVQYIKNQQEKEINL